MKDICLGYVLTLSNKGPPYPLVHPLCLLPGPALLGLLFFVDIGIIVQINMVTLI